MVSAGSPTSSLPRLRGTKASSPRTAGESRKLGARSMLAYIRASCPGFFTQAGPPLLCWDNERLRPPTERPQTGWCDGHSGKLMTWKEWAGRGSGPSLHAAQGTTNWLFQAVPMSSVQAGWLKGPSGANACPSLAALLLETAQRQAHPQHCQGHWEACLGLRTTVHTASLPHPCLGHIPCICPSPPLLSDGRM